MKAFPATFGHYIHNIYGLTETTSPSHGVPLGAVGPGGRGLGRAVGRRADLQHGRADRRRRRPGPAGRRGRRDSSRPGRRSWSGYWNKPEETAKALPGGALHTGDVGYMDEQGWFYIVDRKKDQINAGGYKVWPREVEDVLYEHEAVREAAVVGVPDEYRGETVKAFVSLRPGQHGRRGRAHRVLQGADGGLQVPALRSSSSTRSRRRSPASCCAASSAPAPRPDHSTAQPGPRTS